MKDDPMKLEVMCQRATWRNDIELLVIQRFDDGTVAVGRPITMERIDVGAITDPTVTLKYDMAQMLIDELWRCGLRPSEGTGSAGSLAATERHLKDMQRIAMGLLHSHGVE